MNSRGLFNDLNRVDTEPVPDIPVGKKPWTIKKINPGETFTVESADERLRSHIEYGVGDNGSIDSRMIVKGPVTILIVPDESGE